jgi:segregation and condensation protein A
VSNQLDTDKLLPKVYGERIVSLPQDLYIPPDALEIYLDSFEGPLDLLLYLIRKNNIDILDIPMANLTSQYMIYVEKMKAIKLELAADYLLMSAMLIEIKSRMLLPTPESDDGEELDPRAELVRKLVEYELMKSATQELEKIPQLGKDRIVANAYFEKITEITYPDVSVDELFNAWKNVIKRAKQFDNHKISRSELSVREHMTIILKSLVKKIWWSFQASSIQKKIQFQSLWYVFWLF